MRKGTKLRLTPDAIWKRLNGARRAGNDAARKKTGVHQLSVEKIKKNAKKGAQKMCALMTIPEYKKLHYDKIRFGRLKRKFNRLVFLDF